MSNKDFTDGERLLMLEQFNAESVKRTDSHHLEMQRKLNKIDDNIEGFPTEDAIFRLFSKEGDKLAKGLIKQIDEVKADVTIIQTSRANDAGFISGAKWAFGVILAGLAYVGIKIHT
jgi:hypothetical protein